MKALAILFTVAMCIIFVPIVFGIIGGIFGIIAGIFGAIFGLIAGIIGGIFGAIGWVFDFDGWHFGFFQWNIFTIAALVIIVMLIAKPNAGRKKSN